jgi:hypothetical protein
VPENRGWPDDVRISDLRAAGLPAPSIVRPAKIATVDARDAQRLGTLPIVDREAVASRLRGILGVALDSRHNARHHDAAAGRPRTVAGLSRSIPECVARRSARLAPLIRGLNSGGSATVGLIRRLRPVEVRDVEFLRANTDRTPWRSPN